MVGDKGEKRKYEGKEEGTSRKRRVQEKDGTLVLSLGNMDRVTKELRQIRCLVVGCSVHNTFYKAHAYRHHIPGVFDLRLPSHIGSVAGTTECAPTDTTLGARKECDMGEFIRFVNMQSRSIRVDDSACTDDVHEAMVAFTQFVGEEVPATFQAIPVNAVRALLNWRVLMMLVAYLT